MNPEIASSLKHVLTLVEAGADEHDRDATFPTEVLAVMREKLLAMSVPEAYGGPGCSLREVSDVAYQLGRFCTSTAMIFAMHHQQVFTLAAHAPEAIKRSVLPRVAKGEMYVASVTTEANTGGDLLACGSASFAEGRTLKIDRMAPVCTGGVHADGFLMTVRDPDASQDSEVAFVWADRTQIEVTVNGEWDPVGMRATASAPLYLRGEIPNEQVVATADRSRAVVVETLAPVGHILWASCWLGCADGALSRSLHQLRRQGSGLSEVTRSRLSKMRVLSDATHSFLVTAIDGHSAADSGTSTTAPWQLRTNGLKVFASESARRIVDDLIEVMGMRHGYMKSSVLSLERAWRDLRSAPLNFSNDRLHQSDGALCLMDAGVTHV